MNRAPLEVPRNVRVPGVTVHGFRSFFRDWCADKTNVPDTVAEMALAHAVGSETEKAYRRSDLFQKRVKLMADWARYCDTPQPSGDNVVPLVKTALPHGA